jgi:hypothetical protein
MCQNIQDIVETNENMKRDREYNIEMIGKIVEGPLYDEKKIETIAVVKEPIRGHREYVIGEISDRRKGERNPVHDPGFADFMD